MALKFTEKGVDLSLMYLVSIESYIIKICILTSFVRHFLVHHPTFCGHPHHSHLRGITSQRQVDLKYSQRSTIGKWEDVARCCQLCWLGIFVAEVFENTITAHVKYSNNLLSETLFPGRPFVDIEEIQIMFGIIVFRAVQTYKIFLVWILDVAPGNSYLAAILNFVWCHLQGCWLSIPSRHLGDEFRGDVLVVSIASSVDEITIGFQFPWN